jgi:predicted alpha/beta superfamily hydrolase
MSLAQFKAMALVVLTACLVTVSTASAQTPQAAPFERYGHIERFDIASAATGRTYRIEVWLPASYAGSSRAYPALFLLDGNYSFDAAVALSSYMQRGEIKEHIIVGVSSDVPFGPPLAAVRTPDFTPPTKDGIMAKDPSAPYYRFLRDEFLPQVKLKARIEPDEMTLWTYSLSGSFLAWLNYNDHALFRNYIAASPNWEQFGVLQRIQEGVVFNAPGANHKLFFSFDGPKEMPATPDPDGYLRAFVDAGLPGYKVGYALTKGETHTTSWFATMPAALRFIYGPAAPAP